MQATLWFRESKDGFDFNHLSDGFIPSANYPAPSAKLTSEVAERMSKQWHGAKWKAFEVTLNNNQVVKNLRYEVEWWAFSKRTEKVPAWILMMMEKPIIRCLANLADWKGT